MEIASCFRAPRFKAGGVIFFGLFFFLWASEAAGQPPPVTVEVAPVVRQLLQEEVSFVATLEPDISTTVGSEVSGRVVRSPVMEGDPVVAGKTVLAQLDRTSREISLRGAQAAVDKAREKWEELKSGYRPQEIAQRRAEAEEQRAILARAEEDFRRGRQLHSEAIISQAEFDQLQSEYLAAKEKLERALAALQLSEAGPRQEEIAQAEADYREAKARRDQIAYELEKTTLRSPISGYLVRKHVEVGTWVNPGNPVADIVDLDPMYATGPVGERDIRLLQSGLAAVITLDAFPEQTFRGMVSHIIPQADRQSRTFPVKVSLPNSDGRLKGGMLARVAVRVEGARHGYLVPKGAVVRKGMDHALFLVDGDIARELRVKVGQPFKGMVEVSHPALKSGQEVVVLGNELLADGMKVQRTGSGSSGKAVGYP